MESRPYIIKTKDLDHCKANTETLQQSAESKAHRTKKQNDPSTE